MSGASTSGAWMFLVPVLVLGLGNGTVYEVEEVEEGLLIVMELVDGQTLCDLLDSGPMEVVRAVEIAFQVGSALVGAHAAGVVHRDIKPGNVMIRRDGYVKVLDFGLAVELEVESEEKMQIDEAEQD